MLPGKVEAEEEPNLRSTKTGHGLVSMVMLG